MKTLTEFSGIILAQARDVLSQPELAAAEPEAQKAAVETALSISGERLERLVEVVRAAGDKLKNARLVRVFQGETGPSGAITVGEFHYVIDRAAVAKPARGGRPGGPDKRGRGGPGGDRGRGGPGGDRGRGGPGGFGGGGPGGFGGGGPGGAGKKDRGAPFERLRPGEVPAGGYGWSFSRAPHEPSDKRDRGRGGRKGPPRGNRDRPPGGARPNEGAGRRGGNRPPRGPAPAQTQAGNQPDNKEQQSGQPAPINPSRPGDTQTTETRQVPRRGRPPRGSRPGAGPVVETGLPRHRGQIPPPRARQNEADSAAPAAPEPTLPPAPEESAPQTTVEADEAVTGRWQTPKDPG